MFPAQRRHRNACGVTCGRWKMLSLLWQMQPRDPWSPNPEVKPCLWHSPARTMTICSHCLCSFPDPETNIRWSGLSLGLECAMMPCNHATPAPPIKQSGKRGLLRVRPEWTLPKTKYLSISLQITECVFSDSTLFFLQGEAV